MEPKGLLNPINKLIEEYKDALLKCEDWNAFKFQTGFIRGLERAKQVIEDKFREDPEDGDKPPTIGMRAERRR